MSGNWKVPDELMARCMGRIERVQRVLDLFVAQVEDDLARLESELQAGNPQEMAKIAHRIKGASANAAVESIRLDAETIELLATANQLEELQQCMDRLRTGVRQIADSAAHLHWQTVTSPADGV